MVVRNEARTGSIAAEMVPQSPLANRNSVMDAMMRTFDSPRTLVRASSKVDIDEQSMIWEFFMTSLEAILSPVILRRTLASPIIVKMLDISNDQEKSKNEHV